MRYETPEVIEVGAANDVTLGTLGNLVDSECYSRIEEDSGGGGVVVVSN